MEDQQQHEALNEDRHRTRKMNNSLLDELAVCCCCHKPLDARPWEEEGHQRRGHDRAPSDMCSLCYQTEDDLDQDVFHNMNSTSNQGFVSFISSSDGHRNNSRQPEVSCSDFDLRDLDESVEVDLESSDFFHNPMLNSTMNITQAWVMSTPLIGADTGVLDMTFCEDNRSDRPSSASGRDLLEKKNVRRRKAFHSQDNSSIDSGITSGFDQDTQQLSTLEAETVGPRPTDSTQSQEHLGQRPLTQGSQVEEGELPLDTRPCSTAILQISREQECGVSGISQMDETTREQILNVHGLKREIQNRIPSWEKSSRASEGYSEALVLKERSLKRFLTERAEYLHSFIDRWYRKTATDLETAFAHERDAVSEGKKRADDILRSMRNVSQEAEDLVAHRERRESNGNGNLDLDFHGSVKSRCQSLAARMCRLLDAKVPHQEAPLCVVLNRGSGITPQELGSISVLKARLAPSEGSSQKGPFVVCKAKHLRSFETRRNQEDAAEFMATGLALTSKGCLLVADQGVDSVKAFDTVGRKRAYINIRPGSHQSKAVQLQNGNFAVACKNDLKFFIKNGEYWKKLGQKLYSPQSVTLDPDGNIAVCDVTKSGSTVVRFFDKENFSYLRSVELTGSESFSAYTEDHRPWYLCITSEDNIIVTDFYDHTVKAFTKRGELLWSVGGKGAGLGQFFTPAGLCVDSFGHILVADCLNDRVHILSPAGEFLAFVSSELDGVERPTDVTVDRAGNLWVLQACGLVKGFQYLF